VLSKYDVDGGFLWRRVWGGAGEEQARDLTFVGDAVVGVGELRGSTTFDGVEVTSAGGTDGLVIAVDADDGDLRWVAAFGDVGDDRALSVTATGEGVWAAIAIQGEVEIDGTIVGTPGASSTALTLIEL
jgi:outer membrane protein assembly factor BamB